MLVSRVALPPEICDSAGCTSFIRWGGRTAIYFGPRAGQDFMVILFRQPSDATREARVDTDSGLATARHGFVVLVYYKLSRRVAKLKAALKHNIG